MFEDYPEILNVDEVCEILRCGRNNLYALLTSDNEKNKLRAYRNGRVWKIPKEAVKQFILEQAALKRL